MLSALSSIVFACSGPGAMEAINSNFWKSVLWTVPAIFFAIGAWRIYLQARGKVSLTLFIFCLVPLAIHPVWTESVMVGDCGYGKLADTIFFTVIIGVLLALQFCWWLWQRKFKAESVR